MPPPPCDHFQPPSQADREAADHEDPPSPVPLTLVLPATPAVLSVIRDRLRRWLGQHQWPEAELEDLVLAVGEAASNVVDHAYPSGMPGNVEIDGRITAVSGAARAAELIIRDRGRWRPIPERCENRRRGIPLMRAVVAELVIDGTDHGTCVTMRSPSVSR